MKLTFLIMKVVLKLSEGARLIEGPKNLSKTL